MQGLKLIWYFLLSAVIFHVSSTVLSDDSLKTLNNAEMIENKDNDFKKEVFDTKVAQKIKHINGNSFSPTNANHKSNNKIIKNPFDDVKRAFIRESLHPTIVPFPVLYEQLFGKNNHHHEKLFIHKFGNLRNLISQKQWFEIQAILNQKKPLRTKHFEITKILTEQTKFNKSQVAIFWNDFFDFHVMKKVLMLHNKILQSFGQKSIKNYGIYDVDISVETKVKLLNAQIKRYLPTKDFEIYLKIQAKVFELSKGEKEALLL